MALILGIALIVTAFKLLLIPSYWSTDFEVHRNWLAITHSLPIEKWYFEKTSEWTLDYPPLFAWFEFYLSQVARFFDPEMLVVSNLNYASSSTVLFQRLSVIVADIVYIYAVREFVSKCLKARKKEDPEDIFQNPNLIVAVLMVANFGLFIVDHIHFQYNGFLSGIFLLSVVRMYEERSLESAFWFSVLLNFKHIYLYIAPAYFVYLLRSYCFFSTPSGQIAWKSFSIARLISLSSVVVIVFAVSFGPFILLGQLNQVLSQLFPFKRGLCHAYWAPNFWALYSAADKAFVIAGLKLNLLSPDQIPQAAMTGGMVKEYSYTVLPTILPLVTVVITVLAMLPALFHLWLYPKRPQGFVRAIVLCAFASFLFGWHVHEKAILLVILPMGYVFFPLKFTVFVAIISCVPVLYIAYFGDYPGNNKAGRLLVSGKRRDACVFLILSTVGHYSLFPLIFTQFENLMKVVLLLLSAIYTFLTLGNLHGYQRQHLQLPLLSTLESLYVLGIIPLEIYNTWVHPLLGFSDKLPFLTLMLTSVYCALGVMYCWVRFYIITWQDRPKKLKSS